MNGTKLGKPGILLMGAMLLAASPWSRPAMAQGDARWNALYDRIIRLEQEVRRLRRDYDARIRRLEAALKRARRQGAARPVAPTAPAPSAPKRRAAAGPVFEPLPPLAEPRVTLEVTEPEAAAPQRGEELLGRVGGSPPPRAEAGLRGARPPAPAITGSAPAAQGRSRSGAGGPIPLPGAITGAVGAPANGANAISGAGLAPGRVAVAPLPPPGNADARATSTPSAPAPRPVAIPPALANLSSRALLEKARQNFLARRYEGAEQAYRAWLARFSGDAKTPDVSYELGETLYIQGRFRDAGKLFVQAYRNAGDDARLASRALLRLGQSLKRMGRKKEACKAWATLRARFPDTRAARLQAPREMKRARCKS